MQLIYGRKLTLNLQAVLVGIPSEATLAAAIHIKLPSGNNPVNSIAKHIEITILFEVDYICE